MTSRWARFGRGWLTASVAVFVAALSHLAAGGNAPGWLSVGLALAFAGIASVLLAGKSLSLPRLSVSVGVSQLLLHVLFGLGGASGVTMTSASHHGAVTLADGSASPLMHSAGVMPGGWMWIAHALAAVVTIAALRRGEKTFWALLEETTNRLIAVLIERLAPATIGAQAATGRPAFGRVFVPADLGVLLSSVLRRGPPLTPLAL
ncbi:hypothetical protein [Cryobacterium sp. TMT3-29-2]|uniref:hypothetical protein n=1 Tax=Cryobacterium sp. TMT3-29-2 TaxID=2555867 RepID=UPI0010749213|nr:hypothetical protein [Cryobacterium sp. TMT3-29-2]TFC91110.1 hypothetical protein E3O67_05010 [Cryobacterium sp. TMT3-29-2]